MQDLCFSISADGPFSRFTSSAGDVRQLAPVAGPTLGLSDQVVHLFVTIGIGQATLLNAIIADCVAEFKPVDGTYTDLKTSTECHR